MRQGWGGWEAALFPQRLPAFGDTGGLRLSRASTCPQLALATGTLQPRRSHMAWELIAFCELSTRPHFEGGPRSPSLREDKIVLLKALYRNDWKQYFRLKYLAVVSMWLFSWEFNATLGSFRHSWGIPSLSSSRVTAWAQILPLPHTTYVSATRVP